MRAHILRNTNGVLNVARLGGGPPPPSPVPGDEVDTGDGEEAAAEVADADAPDAATASAPPAPPPVGVHLGALELTDFAVTYTDAALGKTGPVEFVVKDLGLRAKDLMAFLPEPPTPAASVDFSAALAQGENPDACLALVAALGPIGTGIPELNAQARLTGLLLDTLGDLVPSGVRQGLGANGVDLQTGVALNPSSIDLAGVLETDAGHSYPLMVKGPLDKPAVDLGPLMFAVAGRVVGGVANVAEGAAGAATDVAAGVTEGARELRKGVTGVVGSIGGGLLKSATGAMKGDLDQVTEGLTDATTRTAQGAAAAVGAAGGKVAAGVADGADSATGAKRATDWRDAIAARHEEGVAAAREALAAMPFPPPGVVAETTAP